MTPPFPPPPPPLLQAYRALAAKNPSFRARSETTDLIVEISLQPWRAFQPGARRGTYARVK